MNRFTLLLTTIAISLFVALGCSGGGDSPVAPAPGTDITSGSTHSGAVEQTHLWGYWDIYVNPDTMEAEIVANRQAAFTANVTKPLNKNPTALALSFNGMTAYTEYIDVDLNLSITHPFPGVPEVNGYDVRGVFMGDGSATMAYNSDLVYPMLGTDQMMLPDPGDGFGGPDGYTRWYNLTEFSGTAPPLFSYTQGSLATPGFSGNATLCPYRYFADGLGATDDLWTWLETNWTGNSVFSSGSTNTRNYYIRFPNTKGIVFGYAVIANWVGADPGDHPGNGMESMAYRIADDKSDLYFVDPLQNGGNLIFDVSVFDWPIHTLVGGVMEDYTIRIESTVLSTPYEFDAADMTPIATGNHYYTYHVEIPADNVTGVDDNEMWVIVETADYDYSNPFGFPNEADTEPLTAFYRYDLFVGTEIPCIPPEVISIDPNNGYPETVITDALIVCTGLEDGPDLAASLQIPGPGGQTIVGTNVTFIDDTQLTADFDLAGAEVDRWDVAVTNGCGGLPGIGEELFEVLECTCTVEDIVPPSAETDATVDNATITCTDLMDGPFLAASLMMDGETPIPGTDVAFVDGTTLTADFDLTGAAIGFWDVEVTNGCGGTPGVGVGIFEVIEAGDNLHLITSGELPDIQPFPDDKQFCVTGNELGDHQGVYYFGDDYDIMYYPLDYSGPGQVYFTMEGNYGIPASDFFGPPGDLGAIEVDGTGGVIITSHGTGIIWETNQQNMCSIWFEPDEPAAANAMTLHTDFGLVRTKDVEGSFDSYGFLWNLYGTETVIDLVVKVVHNGVAYPYESGSTSGWGADYAPLDQVGSVDGEVSDLEAYKLAVDSDPVGLDEDHDIIFYYLEGDPDDPGIEVFENFVDEPDTYQNLITTIDDVFVGTPVDICVVNSFGNLTSALGNWLCVLEDNGDSTWQIAVFDQDGNLIERIDPINGDPLGLDCDTEIQQVHVWASVDSSIHYTILGW